jgi:hypothetical protein
MSTELKTTGLDPLEEADAEAVLRHAFDGEPLDAEVARRVHERAEKIRKETFERVGYIEDEILHRLLHDDEEQ